MINKLFGFRKILRGKLTGAGEQFPHVYDNGPEIGYDGDVIVFLIHSQCNSSNKFSFKCTQF